MNSFRFAADRPQSYVTGDCAGKAKDSTMDTVTLTFALTVAAPLATLTIARLWAWYTLADIHCHLARAAVAREVRS